MARWNRKLRNGLRFSQGALGQFMLVSVERMTDSHGHVIVRGATSGEKADGKKEFHFKFSIIGR